MRRHLIPVLLLVIAQPGCRQGAPVARTRVAGYTVVSSFHEGRAIVRATESRLYGYLDRDGRMAIPARFAEAQRFSEGLAAVRDSASRFYGYIDIRGELVIPATFEAAFPFSEGLAVVQVAGKQGFIGRDGAERIAARFARADAFSNGRARIIVDGLAGFIDPEGGVTVQPSLFKAGRYRDGLALACPRDKCGYLDLAGNWAIAPRFDDAGDFAEGGAPVLWQGKWGFIDRQGAWIVDPAFDEAHPFRDGAALVAKWMPSQPDRGYGNYTGAGLVYGYIGPDGKWLIEPAIRGASSFAQGLAAIQVPAGQWMCSDCYGAAYVRKDGSLLKGFSTAGEFSEGMAVVTVDRLGERPGLLINSTGEALFEFDGADFMDSTEWASRSVRIHYGYISKQGESILPHRYFSAEPFSGALALVRYADQRKRSRLGYIDRAGAVIIEPPAKASAAQPFSEGLALVTIAGQEPGGRRYAYIDTAGAVRIEGGWAEAQPFAEGLAAVKISRDLGANNWGYINRQGELAIPPQFSAAGPFARGLAHVSRIENSIVTGGLIDTDGNLRIPAFYPEDGTRDVWDTLRLYRALSGPRDLVPVRTQAGFSYAARDGRIAIREPRFGAGQECSEDRAAVMVAGRGGPARWGYIDPGGKLVIEAGFLQARPFSEGLAAVKDGVGRAGYLKRDGQWAIPPAYFEEAEDFREGRARVRINGFHG